MSKYSPPGGNTETNISYSVTTQASMSVNITVPLALNTDQLESQLAQDEAGNSLDALVSSARASSVDEVRALISSTVSRALSESSGENDLPAISESLLKDLTVVAKGEEDKSEDSKFLVVASMQSGEFHMSNVRDGAGLLLAHALKHAFEQPELSVASPNGDVEVDISIT